MRFVDRPKLDVLMGKVIVMEKKEPGTTCGDAQLASKRIGTRVFWRPGGTEQWPPSDADRAEVTEG